MIYAIVESGGKQYKAVAGKTIEVDRLPHKVGDKVQLKQVLLISDGKTAVIGKPTVSGAKVTATVVDQFKAPKIIVFKYKSRQRYRVKKGHRQLYTRLMVEAIDSKSISSKAEDEVKEEKVKKAAKDSAPKTKSKTKTKTKAAAKSKPKTKTAAKAKSKTKTKTKTKTAAKAAPKTKTKTKAAQPSTDHPISELDISKRITDTLADAKIKKVSQFLKLLEKGEDAVLDIDGFGPKSLADLKNALRKQGYTLPKNK